MRRENQNFSGILSADYTLFNGLVATLTGAYVNNRQHYKAFRKFIQYNPNKKSDPNRLNENYYGWHRATFDVLLNYDKRFGRHGLKTLAGWHTEKYTYNESKAERSNFPNNDLTDMNAGDAATVKNSGYSRELAMISWFGRVNYDYAASTCSRQISVLMPLPVLLKGTVGDISPLSLLHGASVRRRLWRRL